MVKLQRLKTAVGRKWLSTRLDRKVHIFSGEWGMYWCPNSSGYTPSKSEAGVYTLGDAWNTSSHCGPEKGIRYEFCDLPLTQPPCEKAKLLLRAI